MYIALIAYISLQSLILSDTLVEGDYKLLSLTMLSNALIVGVLNQCL